jgi:site-specific DNA-methyltransferase (adenine-specific)
LPFCRDLYHLDSRRAARRVHRRGGDRVVRAEADVSVQSIHGDCLVEMGALADGSIDLILADLPYGTTACKWDSVIPFEPLWKHYKRIIKRNGAIVLTASQPFTSALVMSNPGWFRCEWIWQKNAGSNFACVEYQPMKEHESVLVFGEGPTTYNAISERRKRPIREGYVNRSNTGKRDSYSGFVNRGFIVKYGDWRVPSSIQSFNRERGLHPNQKPVALMEYLIRTYTNEGETVLDNTMGSGTTLIACLNTNRNGIGIEKDAEIFATAERRIAAVQAAKSELMFA